ncbi:hemerythrin domain-containing protein [Micromonospora sp. KC207]|uniref:hemerythrin domain-containing protein n=1 Tax=Micromonospora sp. KC207 TaxID=2530377 RepID=UPI00104C629A|nr:hemerythrin domain-containing protein [Micromonospora sp. KC207]TDC46413.1 hemerythrin domain-containing protein [Micromonospora sp. KC207]
MEARDVGTRVHPSSSSPADRLAALGTQLIEIHQWLREELALLRAGLAAGPAPPGDGGRSRSLRAHCLSFCSALTRHHTGEDAGAFRVLAEQVPELRPVLEKLAQDHRLIDGIVRRIEELVAAPLADDPAAAARVLAELDGLTAVVESHFGFEERRIVAALDALRGDAGSVDELLGLRPPDW